MNMLAMQLIGVMMSFLTTIAMFIFALDLLVLGFMVGFLTTIVMFIYLVVKNRINPRSPQEQRQEFSRYVKVIFLAVSIPVLLLIVLDWNSTSQAEREFIDQCTAQVMQDTGLSEDVIVVESVSSLPGGSPSSVKGTIPGQEWYCGIFGIEYYDEQTKREAIAQCTAQVMQDTGLSEDVIVVDSAGVPRGGGFISVHGTIPGHKWSCQTTGSEISYKPPLSEAPAGAE